MKLYDRSDVMSVGVSPNAGGCGQTHSRPVVDGAPSKVFELDCPQCSNALVGDTQWTKHSDDLPKTPDEQAKLDEEAKRGLLSNKADLASGIADGISQGLSSMTSCRNCGKMNFSGKFCGECGKKLGAPAEADDDQSDQSDPAIGENKSADQEQLKQRLEEQKSAETEPTDYDSINLRTLRKMARDEGLDDTGTKDEVIARLKGESK
jgi:hypothetical protein